MPQCSQNPALYDSDGIFNFSLVPWFSGPCWHDGGPVMLRHLVIGAVQVRLVAAGPSDAGARIVGHDQLNGALVKLKRTHVTVDPVRQPLPERCIGEGVVAGP